MTEQDEYDKAFADMAAEPLDINEQQRVIETGNAARQSRRNARLKAAANHAGFATIDQLATAITDGSVVVVVKRNRP